MESYMLQASQIFTIFFIMLGPLRLREPFSLATIAMPSEERKSLAVRTGLIATAALVIGGFVGSILLGKWQIQPPVLLLAGGIIFFLVALFPLIRPETALNEITTTAPQRPDNIALRMVISPQGMAAVIVLLAASKDTKRFLTIVACLVGVMLIDVLSMAFLPPKGKNEKSLVMSILGAAIGTLQVALAMQIIIASLRELKII